MSAAPTPAATLLLVEDDHDLRQALASTLQRAGFEVAAVETAEDGLATLQQQAVDLVISDIRLPGMHGLALLQKLQAANPGLPVVLMTAHADAAMAIAALKAGARDLLLKPFGADALVAAARRHARVLQPAAQGSGLVCHDPLMRTVQARVERAAPTDASVLLTGESGTGKEVMARHLHWASRRSQAPFVAIHCAAIPDSLLEATLFGHEKGAFTGATRQQAGKFEQAQGGTLFLDEVGELPPDTQVKLLRVLQERCVERLGGLHPISVDIRLVCATNRDLAADVASGRFREDLYYRLAVFPVVLPPLRARPGDIVPLARHAAQRYAESFGMGPVQLSPAAEAAMLAHPWPGNVRELENTVQRGLLLCDQGLIEPAHLELQHCAATRPPAPAPLALQRDPGVATAAPVASQAQAVADRPRNVRDVEREHIQAVLQQVAGNRKLAIAILGISERALRYKLKAYREQADEALHPELTDNFTGSLP